MNACRIGSRFGFSCSRRWPSDPGPSILTLTYPIDPEPVPREGDSPAVGAGSGMMNAATRNLHPNVDTSGREAGVKRSRDEDVAEFGRMLALDAQDSLTPRIYLTLHHKPYP